MSYPGKKLIGWEARKEAAKLAEREAELLGLEEAKRERVVEEVLERLNKEANPNTPLKHREVRR